MGTDPHAAVKDREPVVDMAGSREDGHRITDRCQGESEPAARPGAATQQLISLTVAPDTARWLLSPP